MVLFDFTDISDYYNAVKGFLTNIYTLITTVFNFLPNELRLMAGAFVVIIMAIIILKILK